MKLNIFTIHEFSKWYKIKFFHPENAFLLFSALLCVEFFFSVCFVLQQLSSYNNKNSSNNFFFASRQQRTNVMEKSHMEGYVLDEKFFPQFFLLLSVTTCDIWGDFLEIVENFLRELFIKIFRCCYKNLFFSQKLVLFLY